MLGLGAYEEGDRPKDWGNTLVEGGVMLGKDTWTGDRFIMEVASKEGVPVRGVGA